LAPMKNLDMSISMSKNFIVVEEEQCASSEKEIEINKNLG